MSPLEYLQKVGREEADATAKRAKMSAGYFNQICYGHRHASYAMAVRIVAAQHRKGKMTVLSILSHERKNQAGPKRRTASRKTTQREARA